MGMGMHELDVSLFYAINGAHCAAVDWLMVQASNRWLGVAVGLCLALFLAARYRAAALPIVVSAAVAVALSDTLGARIIKPLVGRVRPCFALPQGSFRQLLEAANVGSMPSLHAANVFALATVLTLWNRKTGWVAFPLAALVAFSRVYVGVHWPADVVLGASWGSIAGAFGWSLIRRKLPQLAWPPRAAVSLPRGKQGAKRC